MTCSHIFSSMHVLPSSHGSGVFKHSAPLENHIDYSMVDIPKPDDVCSIYIILIYL